MRRPFRPGHALCALLLLALPAVAARAEDAPAAPADEQAAVRRLVAELKPVVSALRGLPWKHDVPAELLSRDELRAYLMAQMNKEVTPAEMERDTRIVRRLGILRPDEDLQSLQMLMMQELVAGAYDPETKKLYLVRGFVGDGQKPTLVHELTHALDDQYHDLVELEKPYKDDDPDRQFAIRCLFEGSAEVARRAWEDANPEASKTAFEQGALNRELAEGQQRVLGAVPTHMLLSMLLHYRAGPHFVAQAVGRDVAGGLERLFADPPTTQEQILHPYRWLGPARDLPRRVVWGADLAAVAGDGWTKMDEHSVGELDLAMYLDYFLGDAAGRLNAATVPQGKFVSPMASRAARGWDAGRALYLDGPDGHIVLVAAYAFDTDEDAAEAGDILGAALRKANADAWKGHGWRRTGAPDGPRAFDYDGLHGRGRLLQRGREVLVVDGVPADLFERLWPAVEATAFVQADGDAGDALPDPFAGCAVVDHQRGLGLVLPGPTWRGQAARRSPFAFADATNGDVEVSFLVIDQEVTQSGLPRILGMVLGDGFDASGATPTSVMGQPGLRQPLPGRPGTTRALYVGSDATRTFVISVSGSRAGLEAAQDDLARLLRGVPGPGGAAHVPAERPAGLRSIPGY